MVSAEHAQGVGIVDGVLEVGGSLMELTGQQRSNPVAVLVLHLIVPFGAG